MTNRKLSRGALAVGTLLSCSLAFAQSQPNMPPANGSTGDASALVKHATNTQDSSQMLASNILGMPVKNGSGENAQEIGKVTDLVLNQDKKTVNVLIGVGGFLGLGTKDVGVPLNEVQFSPGSQFAVVNLTREQLEKAPTYTTTEMKKSREKQDMQQSGSTPAAGGSPASPMGGAPAPSSGGAPAQ